MIDESKRLEFTSLTCSSNGHVLKVEDLQRGGGYCSDCRGDQFDAIIVKKSGGTDYSDLLDDRSWAARASGNDDRGSWKMDTTYDLKEVPGTDILDWAQSPVNEALDAIHKFRIDEAKQNLNPNQRLCPVCGSIYTLSPYGNKPTVTCSRLCENASKRGIKTISRKRIERSVPTSPANKLGIRLAWVAGGVVLLLLVALEFMGSEENERVRIQGSAEALAMIDSWLEEVKAGRDDTDYWITSRKEVAPNGLNSWTILDVMAAEEGHVVAATVKLESTSGEASVWDVVVVDLTGSFQVMTMTPSKE